MFSEKLIEEIERECLIEDLSHEVNEETVSIIMEAVDHPETLHKLTSWEELGL
jgi:hypothetical protein